MDRSGWAARGLLIVALVAGGAARLHLALTDQGIYWPDEIYQSLEPAHRLVFGYGLVAWEFLKGARSWAFPGLIAGLLKLAQLSGLDSPRAYLTLVRSTMAAIGTLTIWAVYRLSRRLGAEPLFAAVGAASWAGGALFIYFAPRAMTECLSALVVPLGFADALSESPPTVSSQVQLRGAAWLAASVFLRLHNALFCVALLVGLALQRRFLQLGRTSIVFAVGAFALGLLDRLTWGHWFQSSIEYLRFNLVEGKAAQWGTAGPGFYARVLWSAMPAWTVIVTLTLLAAVRRVPLLVGAIVLFLLAHVGVGHKEIRFILPVLPLCCAGAAIGMSRLKGERFFATALLIATLVSGLRFHSLTFGELGQYENFKPSASAYDDFGPINRLLLAAYDQNPRCGLKIEGVHLAWTGGYSYFHRPVPLYAANGPPRASEHYDFVITPRPWARGMPVLAEDGNFVLARLPLLRCVPDSAFSWNLP
jgi:hypothetical protein